MSHFTLVCSRKTSSGSPFIWLAQTRAAQHSTAHALCAHGIPLYLYLCFRMVLAAIRPRGTPIYLCLQ